MTEINATLVKALRERTGAGVIDCKKALVETHGDVEAAVDRLRAAEIANAVTKVNRVAAEGLVGLAVEGMTGAVIELNTETDFVARTGAFRSAAAGFAGISLRVQGDRGRLLDAAAPDGDGTVSDAIARMTARTGERVNLRRSAFVSVNPGVVASYVHNPAGPGLGSIGVLVAVESRGEPEALLGIGHKIAMHVAANAPLWVSREDIPADVVARKRAELTEQAHKTGKPPEIAARIVDGRMRRFYEEVVLELQPFVLDPGQRVGQTLKDAGYAAGAAVAIKGFVRFRTGEGIEKPVPTNDLLGAAMR